MRSRGIPGHVKDRDALMRDANIVVDDSTITSHVKRIRRKFHGGRPGVRPHRDGVRHGLSLGRIAVRLGLSIRAQLLLVLTVFLALPWLGVRVRARARARAARRAGAHARRHRASRGDRAARPPATVRQSARPDRVVRARARQRARRQRRHAAAVGVARDRADHRRAVAHDGAHLGHRSRRCRARARGIARAAAGRILPNRGAGG